MVDVPERIWIEHGEDCPYFYEESELTEVGSPVTEYVRADLYAALEAKLAALSAENERLREALADLCDWIEHEVGAELPFDARRVLEGGNDD